MKLDDLSLGGLVLIGGLAVLVSSFQFSAIPGQAYGADTMPRAIGVAAIALGLFLTAAAVAGGARVPSAERSDWARSGRALALLALTLALVLGYIALSGPLGFIPVAVTILLVLMLALGVRAPVSLAVAIAGALVIQFCFGRLLLVPLPRNPFFDLPW
jgi:putative tricarboxylic transport membrane protein